MRYFLPTRTAWEEAVTAFEEELEDYEWSTKGDDFHDEFSDSYETANSVANDGDSDMEDDDPSTIRGPEPKGIMYENCDDALSDSGVSAITVENYYVRHAKQELKTKKSISQVVEVSNAHDFEAPTQH